MNQRDLKTYKHATGDGRTIRVTVPDDPTPESLLDDAFRENFTPAAVAAIAERLFSASTKDGQVNRQIRWLADRLVKLVGTNEYTRLLEEVGL